MALNFIPSLENRVNLGQLSSDKASFSGSTFFAILGRGPGAFQIGKISGVNPLIGKIVIVHICDFFGQLKNDLAIKHTFAIKK